MFLTAFPPALAFIMEHVLGTTMGFSGLGAFGHLDGEIWFSSSLGPGDVMWRMLAVLAITFAVLWSVESVVAKVWRRRVPKWLFLIGMVAVPLLAWRAMGLDERVFDLAGTMALMLGG